MLLVTLGDRWMYRMLSLFPPARDQSTGRGCENQVREKHNPTRGPGDGQRDWAR